MNVKTMLADFLRFVTPKTMHKARFSVLLDAVTALTKDARCTVTAIGRPMPEESLVGKAISYTQKQWPKLIRYLEDGQLNIDNNRAERAVKPFVIGRKAWLFVNTKTGAKASAALYNLVETAKINGLEPYHYLTQLFEQLPTAATPDQLAKLLPY